MSDESLAIANAIESISADFPAVPHEMVVSMVNEELTHFDGKPIRDFVPVLVETHVRGHLKAWPAA
jgi:hypothetical protein